MPADESSILFIKFADFTKRSSSSYKASRLCRNRFVVTNVMLFRNSKLCCIIITLIDSLIVTKHNNLELQSIAYHLECLLLSVFDYFHIRKPNQ